MKYEYSIALLENVTQSLSQALRKGEKGTQEVGVIFRKFSAKIKKEGWRIIAVNLMGKVIMYTLEREAK